eukprot:12427911-Karenia_brevis.AAC.1
MKVGTVRGELLAGNSIARKNRPSIIYISYYTCMNTRTSEHVSVFLAMLQDSQNPNRNGLQEATICCRK